MFDKLLVKEYIEIDHVDERIVRLLSIYQGMGASREDLIREHELLSRDSAYLDSEYYHYVEGRAANGDY